MRDIDKHNEANAEDNQDGSSSNCGELPAQHWPLRVTLVYRRDGAGWRLAHRHADPLVAGVTHATAAALARGDIR